MSNIYETSLSSPHFEDVKEGKKIYEVRCFYDKVVKYRVGDILKIKHSSKKEDVFQVEIEELSLYSSFEEAISSVSLNKVLPHVQSLKEGVDLYHSIPNYKEREKEFGVCRIKVKLSL
jgi:ASC-1-like (ASCH) protein